MPTCAGSRRETARARASGSRWTGRARCRHSTSAPPTSVPVWAPSHVVPAGGLPAWDAPEPARQPVAILSERVELVLLSRAGAWAQVRGVNGWTGWVDGRRIVERRRA